MKTLSFYFVLFFMSCNTFAQCYSTIVNNGSTIIARKTDGTLWGRGLNSSGLLGNGATATVDAFVQIGIDSNWTDMISISYYNVFAIKTDGTLWSWGANSFGVLGVGELDESMILPPTQIGTDNWLKVAGSGDTAFAIKIDGTLWSWGSNSTGKLGVGVVDNFYKVNIPNQVSIETNWVKVYTGYAGVFAIKADGTLWSWGSESPSQLGYINSNLNNSFRIPNQVGIDTNWSQISVGATITYGIKTDGKLWAWGNTSNGLSDYLFGNGFQTFTSIIPMLIDSSNDWKEIYVDQRTIVGLKTNGTRWGWGENNAYQLGIGEGMNSLVTLPTQLDTATDWKYVVSNLGLKQNNSLQRWGRLYPNAPSTTFFIPMNYGNDCALSNTIFETDGILLYPNPTNDLFTIKVNDSIDLKCDFIITNNLGQIVFRDKVITNNINEFQFNISDLQSGVYIVYVKSNTKIFQTKIIKK